MGRPILDDGLWTLIEPLLPKPKKRRFRYPGRKRIEDRKAMTGILFVLRTGIGWEYLPQEMGCGSGMTCWRRLREWQKAGVWEELHRCLLNLLNNADQIDWDRAVIDSASVRAVFGGPRPGQIRRTAAKPAANITCSPMGKASRWRAPSPAQTRTMSHN